MLNMMKKALALLLALGFGLATMPVAAQDFGPNTIWGEVPAGVTNAANAVLQDGSGRVNSRIGPRPTPCARNCCAR